MTFAGWLTIVLFAVILTALAFPLGQYMAKVYTGAAGVSDPGLCLARAVSLPDSVGRSSSASRTGRDTRKAC